MCDEEDESIRVVTVEGVQAPRKPKQERAKKELELALLPDSNEELPHGELLARLPGLKAKAYGERTAREALKALVGEIFEQRKEGTNVFYRRIKAG